MHAGTFIVPSQIMVGSSAIEKRKLPVELQVSHADAYLCLPLKTYSMRPTASWLCLCSEVISNGIAVANSFLLYF